MRIIKFIFGIIVLVLHKYYPPRLFIFYPLYKVLRHRWQTPFFLSIMGVWFISAVLHGLALLLCSSPEAALIFFFIFCILGILSSAAATIRKQQRQQLANHRTAMPLQVIESNK